MTIRIRRGALVLPLVAAMLASCTSSPVPSGQAGSSKPPSVTSSPSSPLSSSSSSSSYGPQVRRGSDYLALGDSVSFGYREPTARPKPDYAHAAAFVGFPELVARAMKLHVANAACPGETSTSLLNSGGASNGCERGATGASSGGYRTHYPLHVRYRGSQLAYGVHYLRTHRTTRLVTLMIGANDAFRCVATTSDQCVSEFSGLLTQLTTHVTTILQALRGGARYTGQLVLVTYYASNYHGIAATESSLLDSALTSPARRFRALIANGYSAFGRVAMRSGGDTCRAGLLTTLTTGGCGVHPSAAGQRLLAETVERAIIPS